MPKRSRLLRCEPLEDRLTPAAAGDLDPTFGIGGRVVLDSVVIDPALPPTTATPTAVAVQSDDRIVVAESVQSNLWVARFTADGKPDLTFDTDGKVSLGIGAVVNAIAFQPDGRIVLVGNTVAGNAPDFAAYRLAADGKLDPSFGDGGKTSIPFEAGSPMQDRAVAVVVQPDGRIILGGSTRTLPPPFTELSDEWTGSFAAARLTADGQLDPTFGTGGRTTVPFPVGGYNSAAVAAMAVQPDGRIILAGSARSYAQLSGSLHGPRYFNHDDFAAVRLTADGTLDPTFGDGGRVHLPFDLGGPQYDDSAKAVAVRPDGAIELAGTAGSPDGTLVVVARLKPDGQLDPTYDGDGKAGTTGDAGAAAVLSDGRVLFVGGETIRLTADGQPDPTYGSNGRAPTPFYNPQSGIAFLPSGLAVQPDGNFLLVGRLQSDGLLARVLGSPSPVPTTVTPGSLLAGGTADGTARLLSSIGSPYRVSDAVSFFPGSGVTVRTTVADVTGDGVPDLIGGTGPGGGPAVRVLDGATRAELASFFAFEPGFTGGVFVATADLDGDGRAEVIVTPDRGGGPVVAVFDGTGVERGRFFGIDDPNFRGGARPTLGDVNGDGTPDLIVSAGFGGGPRVAVFGGKSVLGGGSLVKLVPDFFAFENSLRNGAFVAAGDVTGDGVADFAFGGGPGGAPRVRLFDGKALLAAGPFSNLDAVPTAQRADFFAGDSSLRGGVRLVLRDADGDGKADLVTGSGEGEPSQVQVYPAQLLTSAAIFTNQKLDPFGAVLADGVFVG